MKINIPCPTCGCQTCQAKTLSGEKVTIEVCSCPDGSGNYDLTIYHKTSDPVNETYRSRKDLEDILSSQYEIDLNSIEHNCN